MASLIDTQFLSFLFFTWVVPSLLIWSFLKKRSRVQTIVQHRHPPSPPALPIIGHLHLLFSQILPKSFQALASRYGPLMRIHIGASTCLVVSNAAVAREILKTHDLSFASRPQFGSSDYSIYKGSRFLTAEYGVYWRFMRKVCMMELLAAWQLDRFAGIRRQEMMKLLRGLVESSRKEKASDLGMELISMTNNVICRMAMSTRCSDKVDEAKEVMELVKEILKLAAKLSLGEVLGPLKKLDLFGFGRRLQALLMQFDELVEGVMNEHEKEGAETYRIERRDMMDILLDISKDESAEVKLTRKDIKSFFLDVFLAGTETMSVAMQWTIAELINHPDAFKRLRDEINSVVGPSRLLEESDIPNLPYLEAVVKESLRLHPPAPLLIRQCRENTHISGYDILANSRVLINLYAVMRDPEIWEDSTEFVPERFSSGNCESKMKEQQFHYIPFGSGRRVCPGASLVGAVMHSTVGALVQCFDWKTKGGGKLNMKEGLGFSAGMACPLVCYPTALSNTLEAEFLSE